jgi:oligopeptidase B
MPVSEAILHPLSVSPPLADRRDHVLVLHGDERQDPYYWLRDDSRQDPAVLDYLRAENEYTRQVLAPLQGLQKTLYREMRGRQKPDDSSLPYFYRGYWYVTRYEAEAEFPCYERHPGDLQAQAERLLDAQERASTSDFYELGTLEVSPDERYLAVSEDWVSRRQYRIQIRDLQSGLWLPDVLESCSSELVWAADSRSFFYVRLDDETLLPYQVWNHVLGEPGHRDRLIYEEVDDSYYLSLEQSRSEQLLLISLHSTLSSEIWWLPLTEVEDEPVCFLPRRRGHEYQLDHFADHVYIRSNHQGANFGLYRTHLAVEPVQRESDWLCLLAPRQEVLLQQFELFSAAILLEERQAGLARLRQLDLNGAEVRAVQFADPCYVTWLGFNPDPHSTQVRYGYSSLTTPVSTYALDLTLGTQILLKQQPVLGVFDPACYASERLWLQARDGASVPVSLVYRRDRFVRGGNPLLVYGYGAYGLSEEPDFSSSRLSLLDRGFVYAIAHVRGGEELGRHWYEQGRGEHKLNSFHDFIDVTQGLLVAGYADPQRVFAMGGSAGGLLMGGVINMAPELYLGVVAAVPFVDVLTSMLDESIPLTTGEYDEWGNPNNAADYAVIRRYSPYDQIRSQKYPHLLVVSGLHDSQVQYWEPAKWVAKLRHEKTDDHWLLLAMDMSAGHGGKAGRYHHLHDVAREYAFLLHLAGIAG